MLKVETKKAKTKTKQKNNKKKENNKDQFLYSSWLFGSLQALRAGRRRRSLASSLANWLVVKKYSFGEGKNEHKNKTRTNDHKNKLTSQQAEASSRKKLAKSLEEAVPHFVWSKVWSKTRKISTRYCT